MIVVQAVFVWGPAVRLAGEVVAVATAVCFSFGVCVFCLRLLSVSRSLNLLLITFCVCPAVDT